MVIDTNAIISGSTSLIAFIVGWGSGIACIQKARNRGAKLLYGAALFLICMGMLYLGPITSFFSLLINGTNIAPVLVAQLSYTIAPIGVAIGMYFGMSIIKPSLVKFATICYLIATPIYWYGLYSLPEAQLIAWEIAPNGLIDISFIGYMEYLTVFLLFSFGVILILGFLWLFLKSSGFIRTKAWRLCLAFTIFLLCGSIESMIDIPTLIGFVRIIMAGDYTFIYWVLAKGDISAT